MKCHFWFLLFLSVSQYRLIDFTPFLCLCPFIPLCVLSSLPASTLIHLLQSFLASFFLSLIPLVSHSFCQFVKPLPPNSDHPITASSSHVVLTCHQQDGVFIGMQLHLPGDPGPVEVSVPPALLLVLRVFVLVARPDEWDAEVALLPVHRHLVLPGRYGRGWVLLSCWLDGGKKKVRCFSVAIEPIRSQWPCLHAAWEPVNGRDGQYLLNSLISVY